MTLGFEFRGRPVVDRFVGAQNVIPVMDHHSARAGPEVAFIRLRAGRQQRGNAGLRRRFGLGYGHQLKAGLVGKLLRRSLGAGIGTGSGRRRRLPVQVDGKKSRQQRQQRDHHSVTRVHPRTKAQHNKSGRQLMGRAPSVSGSRQSSRNMKLRQRRDRPSTVYSCDTPLSFLRRIALMPRLR